MKLKSNCDIAKCCAMCEHAMRLEFKRQYLCRYKNNIAEVEPEDICRHFEPDLLKLEPKPKKSYKFDA